MKISHEGLSLVKLFEGFRSTTYLCSAGVPTIGYGHTAMAGAPDPSQMTSGITELEASEILDRDLDQYEQGVLAAIRVPIKQRHFDAMVSLCYNIGVGAFKRSSVAKFYNQGNIPEAANAFLLWNKANGKVNRGLVNRRSQERDFFLGGNLETMPQKVDVVESVDVDNDGIIDVAKVGKSHPSIAAIHTALHHLGFEVKTQEFYSQHTASLIRAFQKKHGLTVDGVFGGQTRKKMEHALGINISEFLKKEAA